MKNYIYLDWNVIQYIKHETVNKNLDAKKFKEHINALSKIYVFPISEGHLRDLSSGYSIDNKYITEDLTFIKQLSNNLMLGVADAEKIVPVTADASVEFSKIIEEVQPELDIKVTGDAVKIDMEKLPINSLFRASLEKNNNTLSTQTMSDFIEEMWELRDDPDFYKKFREETSKIKTAFKKSNTVLNQQTDYFERLSSFLNFFSITDPDELKDKFNDILISFLSIDGRNLNSLTKGEKIEIAYGLLDIHPLFRDKITKKNRPGNLGRDIKHLFFASDAKYYITEDDATYKKSAFIAKVLKLKVKIMKMDELRLRVHCT